MESVAFIEWCLEHLNYWTITLLMAIESSFIPFPSEVVVPPAAWLSADPASGLNVYLVVFFATVGALIGALVNYLLALWLGRPIVYKFANSRFGHMCLIDEPAVKKAEEYFDKRGAASTFIGRLIPAVRQLISIPAGLARMKMSENYYLDLSGYGIFRHGMLRRGIDEMGVERFLFGSDYPTCNPAMYIGGVAEDFTLTAEEKQAVLYDNAARLLKL